MFFILKNPHKIILKKNHYYSLLRMYERFLYSFYRLSQPITTRNMPKAFLANAFKSYMSNDIKNDRFQLKHLFHRSGKFKFCLAHINTSLNFTNFINRLIIKDLFM